jgi:hypothetical protein
MKARFKTQEQDGTIGSYTGRRATFITTMCFQTPGLTSGFVRSKRQDNGETDIGRSLSAAAHAATKKIVLAVFLIMPLWCWADGCVLSDRRDGPVAASPDGQYQVVNLLCSRQVDDKRAALVLVNRKTGARRTLYYYTRGATVVWSPDSRRIAINDYAGSDNTNNLVYSVDQDGQPVDLQKQLDLAFSRYKWKPMPDADHFYMSVIRWTSRDELKLIAWGHGGEPTMGFCRCFFLNLVDGTGRRCHLDTTGDPEGYCEKIKK